MNRLTKLNKRNEWAISLEDVSHVLSGNRYDTGEYIEAGKLISYLQRTVTDIVAAFNL